MARQRRHSFEDRHLPLFRENQNPEALFNSDGERRISVNPLLRPHGKTGAGLYLPAYTNWKTAGAGCVC